MTIGESAESVCKEDAGAGVFPAQVEGLRAFGDFLGSLGSAASKGCLLLQPWKIAENSVRMRHLEFNETTGDGSDRIGKWFPAFTAFAVGSFFLRVSRKTSVYAFLKPLLIPNKIHKVNQNPSRLEINRF